MLSIIPVPWLLHRLLPCLTGLAAPPLILTTDNNQPTDALLVQQTSRDAQPRLIVRGRATCRNSDGEALLDGD